MSKKYEILYKTILEKIALMLAEGEIKLPTERELSLLYNVSRQTVRRALLVLTENGFIEKIQGSGLYLTGKHPDHPQQEIALLIPGKEDYLFPAFISQLTNILSDKGFSLSIYTTNEHSDEERNILKTLVTQRPSAVIVFPVNGRLFTPNIDLYETLTKNKIPVLFCGRYYQNLRSTYCVREDYYTGGYLAGEYLTRAGHTDIAAILRTDSYGDQEKLLGLERSLYDNDCSLAGSHIFSYDTRSLTALRQNNNTTFLHKFINQGLTTCSAVICSNDEIAYHIIKELTLAGISIPEDMRVISFDNSYLSTLSSISITSLAIKNTTLAAETARVCLNLIKNQPADILPLPYELHQRKS